MKKFFCEAEVYFWPERKVSKTFFLLLNILILYVCFLFHIYLKNEVRNGNISIGHNLSFSTFKSYNKYITGFPFPDTCFNIKF